MRVWDFVYLPDKSGEYRITLDTTENPRFFLCGRRFPRELRGEDFNGFEEVITLTEPLELMTEETARNYPLEENQQILCEYCMLDKIGNDIDDPDIAERVIEGFTFCGFDIADEEETSALTNCGFEYDKAFTKADLNRWGLIDDYQKAWAVLYKIYEEYGDDPDLKYLMLFAVWRRIREV